MQSFIDPAILFFVFGVFAGLVRSNLEIPPAISRFLSLYLLMALGLKGGFALAESGLNAQVLISLGAALAMASAIPLLSYVFLKTIVGRFDAAAIAATYGSVSAVTFITAVQYLDTHQLPYGGHMAAAMALLVGIPMGVYAALRRGSLGSQLLMTLSLLGVSLPTFLIGILLILFFAVLLGWFPSFGRGDVVKIGWWSTGLLTAKGWHHIILPALTLTIFQLTLIMRLVRAEMLEVLRTDYIKFARARGLSNSAIHFGHALKNTLVPVMTITGLQLGGLIAFAIITETVFQWPGMGLLFIQAVTFADIPVMAAYLCLIALIFVVINLIVDLLYFAVDPRLRVGKAGGH
jgi:ABC-type antimicrobial peptide transport system permease subunit